MIIIDARKQLADGLETFVPTIMQTAHEIASRLELFRTETLASFEPVDRKDSAVSDMNSYMDNLIGLERFQVPEIPIVNSRAGLYIYLDAAVSCSVGVVYLPCGDLLTVYSLSECL